MVSATNIRYVLQVRVFRSHKMQESVNISRLSFVIITDLVMYHNSHMVMLLK
jgi:hypothetical protein